MCTRFQYAHRCTRVGSVCVCTWRPEVNFGVRSSAVHLLFSRVSVFVCVHVCAVLVYLCVHALGGWRPKSGVPHCSLPLLYPGLSVNAELAASASLGPTLYFLSSGVKTGRPHPPGICMGSGHLNSVQQALSPLACPQHHCAF